jgi:hypothetical protein
MLPQRTIADKISFVAELTREIRMAPTIARVAAMHNSLASALLWENTRMSPPAKLLEPYQLGPIKLPNRLMMAPLTRNRAVPPGMVPSPLAVDYYGQRASAGLRRASIPRSRLPAGAR